MAYNPYDKKNIEKRNSDVVQETKPKFSDLFDRLDAVAEIRTQISRNMTLRTIGIITAIECTERNDKLIHELKKVERGV